VCAVHRALLKLGLLNTAGVAMDGSKIKAVMEKQMLASSDEQISLTDLDSRSMAASGRGSGVVRYNVQVATETEHHLIIAHEVTNVGNDTAHLANIAVQAKGVFNPLPIMGARLSRAEVKAETIEIAIRPLRLLKGIRGKRCPRRPDVSDKYPTTVLTVPALVKRTGMANKLVTCDPAPNGYSFIS
jgi:hypothetical protein